MQKIRPFLWFDGCAREAIDHYVSIFPNARVVDGNRFELEGQEFIAFDGGPEYRFTPAISFMVACADQAEIDRLWQALVAGGTAMRCGWLTDRFGVSWQIVPANLSDLLDDPDPEKAERIFDAMLAMEKLDIGALEAARRGS